MYMTIGQTIALTICIFVGVVMSLLFNMLSRSVSFSSKEQAPFNFMAVVIVHSDFGAPQNKVCHCLLCFHIYFPWSDGTNAIIFVFWMLIFKTTFSLSSFTFIKRLFSSSSLSAIRVVLPAYLRLWIFLMAILISVCASSIWYFAWCTLHIS